MSEESTTTDLVGRWHDSYKAFSCGDLDAAFSIWAADGEWDTGGVGVYKGLAATRSFFEEWLGNYDEFRLDVEEILDLGTGVTLALLVQQGRLAGSEGELQLRYAAVAEWADGKIVRITNYADRDEARATAERLAEERG
jgi:ketosteroid isomerase-like protein